MLSILGAGKDVESPPTQTKKVTIAKNKDQATCEKLPSHLPLCIFSRTLCEKFATMENKPLVKEAPPQVTPQTPQTDVFVARYKKLEVLLRHALNSGDFTALFNRNKPMVDKEPRISDAVRLAAQRQVFDRLQSDLLTQEEMMEFYYILEKWADKTPKPMHPAWFQWVERSMREKGMLLYDKYIDYVGFTKAKAEMHPKIREWLTTTKFFTLMTESDDMIFHRLPIVHLYNYVTKKVWLVQVRLGLVYYDVDCQGYLTEESMEAYIRDMIPTLPHLDGMDPVLEPFYLCAATRKFFFFLDPRRIDKVQIVAIISSLLLDEIFELRDFEVRTTNWFGIYSLLRTYKHYVFLDTDANGMLSPKEFLKFNYSSQENQICLTETFVNALFSEKMTYHGEMDFRTYIDFVLAIENKTEEQSISYFVKVLDIDGKGYLNSADLHYFYKDVYKILLEFNPEPPKFEDVKDEIFDMVKPPNPCRITAADLFNSGKGGYVIGMLIDAKTLDDYENLDIVGNSQE